MGEYLDNNKPMGANVKKLLTVVISRKAVQGGGLGDVISYFTEPGKLQRVNREAMAFVEQAIMLMKSAPDNPYGDDDEAIAAAILKSLEERG